mmetsp:Transcript_77996/g.178441  ORF Transcript_77996/g.178441 Transcript_77996/m.178441 type:complete len:88 (-) Transcript_77996:141-404(-)
MPPLLVTVGAIALRQATWRDLPVVRESFVSEDAPGIFVADCGRHGDVAGGELSAPAIHQLITASVLEAQETWGRAKVASAQRGGEPR